MTSTGMRSRLGLAACLALTCSSPALARGGPGGAWGSALETFLQVAIVVGIVVGSVCAFALRRLPWKSLALLFVVALVIAVTSRSIGMFLGLPALVSCAVFASVFHWVRGGVLHARDGGSSRTTIVGTAERESSRDSEVLRWIAATYAFWVAVSLANFELLGFLAVPPVLFLSFGTIGRFLPFILPPLAVAVLLGALVTALAVKRRRASRQLAPLIFNACVLVAFFVSTEVFRYYLMTQSLSGHRPDHLERSSFLTSVLTYRTYGRQRHGGFEENGKVYRWSYSEREFVPVP